MDVSASMQSYAAAYLHLMRAFARTGRAETFAFSTRLTRLTPALVHRSADTALALAEERVVDRYGGTHLAGALRDLLPRGTGRPCAVACSSSPPTAGTPTAPRTSAP